MGHRVFEHTADVGIEAEGADLDDLFRSAARGLFEVVRGDNVVRPLRPMHVTVDADRLDRLLIAFLEEFIFLQDAEGLVFHDVTQVRVVETPDGRYAARATAAGEPFDHGRHPGCLHVKAVTRHDLDVAPPAAGRPARARFILDI